MSKGYTLIELVVTVGIVVLLSGGAIVAFINFRDRKQAVADVREVTDFLRKVRIKATAVDIPLGVSGVRNYTVVIGANSITANVAYGLNSWVNDYVSPKIFSTGTVFKESPADIVYEAKSGVIGTARILSVCGVGKYGYTIAIDASGVVSDPVVAVVSGCP